MRRITDEPSLSSVPGLDPRKHLIHCGGKRGYLVLLGLDIENVATFKGELLFWIAILISNSLGTSTGDFMSDTLGLGFRTTALILSAIMLALAVAHYRTKVNGTLLFWIAFVLTRPLRTVFGNILSKEYERGGLNFGTVWTSGALLAVLMALVAYQVVQVRRRPLRPLPLPVQSPDRRPTATQWQSRRFVRCIAPVHRAFFSVTTLLAFPGKCRWSTR
jgi:hypothetical protein